MNRAPDYCSVNEVMLKMALSTFLLTNHCALAKIDAHCLIELEKHWILLITAGDFAPFIFTREFVWSLFV